MNTVASLPAKLLPCPFCGNAPRHLEHDAGIYEESVICDICHIATRGFNEAIPKWNLRAPALATPAVEGGTPSSRWAANGESDPHGTTYDCERAALAMGDFTDDELANAVFLHGNERPSINDLESGKAMPAIAYLMAAKDRIRWLSRRLASSAGEEEAVLPCDVRLPPATTITAGCKLSTLVHAMELRKEAGVVHFPPNDTTPPPAPAAEQGLNLPDTFEQFVAEQQSAPSLPLEQMMDDFRPEARGVEGMVLVPRELTEAMVNAARGFSVPGYCIAAEQWPYIYRAMLAAAPAAPVGVEAKVHGIVALLRQPEPSNGEKRTEHDEGYEQASSEIADMLEAALSQQPAAPSVEGGAGEADKMLQDALQHGTGVMRDGKHVPLDQFHATAGEDGPRYSFGPYRESPVYADITNDPGYWTHPAAGEDVVGAGIDWKASYETAQMEIADLRRRLAAVTHGTP